jgi:hypothetical protein
MLAVTSFFLPGFYLAGSSGVVGDKVFRTTICFLTTLVAQTKGGAVPVVFTPSCSQAIISCLFFKLNVFCSYHHLLLTKKFENMVQVWAPLADAILNGNR